MKILFIYPGIAYIGYGSFLPRFDSSDSEPIYAFALLAAILQERGHEVELLDMRMLDSEEAYRSRLVASGAHVAAITIQTPSFLHADRAAQLAKEAGMITIAGGIHATVCPEDFEGGHWDHVMRFEGEIALPRLVGELQAGHHPLKHIEGDLVEDLDSLPLPHFFPEWGKRYQQTYGIEAARGCPGRCTYCISGDKRYYRRMRFRSVEHTLREIDFAFERFQFKHLLFLDVNATSRRTNFNQLLRIIGDRYPQLDITIQDRADSFSEETAKLLTRFHSAIVWFGFETMSPRMLEFLNKECEIDEALLAVELCRRHGLKIGANALIGVPTETEADILATYRFFEAIRPDQMFCNILSPFPGTQIHRYCVEQGLLPKGLTWEDFEIRNILEHGLIQGINYDYIRAWHRRFNDLLHPVPVEESMAWTEDFVLRAKTQKWKVALFGAGAHAKYLLDRSAIRSLSPLCIFDNDADKWQKSFEGLRVESPERIQKLGLDAVLITTFAGEAQIKAQLHAMDIQNLRIHSCSQAPDCFN